MGEKDKYEAILRIENSLKEKGLQELYLLNTLYLTEPFRDNPYSVDEICIGNEGKACAWCHWDQRSDGHYLRNFSEREVLLIEQACNEALACLKKYRVQIVSYVEVDATDERKRQKMLFRMPDDYRKIYCPLIWAMT